MFTLTNETLRGQCAGFPPFLDAAMFPAEGGYVDGRLCQKLGDLTCCLPCPMTDWAYPDNFDSLTSTANWISVVGVVCCLFLLASWALLPVEKTHRHYLSISLVVAIIFMNLGFIIPLAGKPDECYNEITPHGMDSSPICAASGAFLLGGGWAGVMWVFLRSMSLHLQICWQTVVGRNFMWLSQALGWGIPAIGLVVALLVSGVSFRFGSTCHINHANSLNDFWIPLLVFAGLTVIIQFATFGYCIKVYLASLADSSASTDHSGMPSYTASIRTMTPRQAYRRVRRVIQLQWRGIVIVLIIICDVIFFAVIFVFQDTTVESIKNDPEKAAPWILCLVGAGGDKTKCLDEARELVVALPTVIAVLILLAMNGIWLLFLLGRWSMVTGWIEKFSPSDSVRAQKEFVSVDARIDLKTDQRSYEIATKSPASPRSGRQTPDYFGPAAARYQPHARSFSSPRPPQQNHVNWEGEEEEMPPSSVYETAYNTPYQAAYQPSPPSRSASRTLSQSRQMPDGYVDPLGLNRL